MCRNVRGPLRRGGHSRPRPEASDSGWGRLGDGAALEAVLDHHLCAGGHDHGAADGEDAAAEQAEADGAGGVLQAILDAEVGHQLRPGMLSVATWAMAPPMPTQATATPMMQNGTASMATSGGGRSDQSLEWDDVSIWFLLGTGMLVEIIHYKV